MRGQEGPSSEAYGVRTSGVLVSYGVRTLYAYRPDRGISKGTRGWNTLSIPYPNPIDTLCLLGQGAGTQKI